MEVGTQLVQTEDGMDTVEHFPYREIIGSLLYAATLTRPDIAFAVSALAQFAQRPARPHWEATKRIMRYLKATRELGLTYGASNDGIVGYTDADHASQYHRHSISGYAFLINGGAISWSSKKQPLVALSTTEAEYIAVAHATKEALCLRAFLGEITRPPSTPMPLHCDNQSAIALSKDGQFHARTKHIDLRFHFIRETVANGDIDIVYCPTQTMVADILTKPLNRGKTGEHTGSLGLLPTLEGGVLGVQGRAESRL